MIIPNRLKYQLFEKEIPKNTLANTVAYFLTGFYLKKNLVGMGASMRRVAHKVYTVLPRTDDVRGTGYPMYSTVGSSDTHGQGTVRFKAIRIAIQIYHENGALLATKLSRDGNYTLLYFLEM